MDNSAKVSNSFQNENLSLERNKGFFQLDLLKAWMILLVVVDHTVPSYLISPFGSSLWERISIPVFLIIMGMNMGYSFKKKNQTKLSELYSKKYFIRKILRYFLPFIIAWIVSTIVGVYAFYDGSISQMINERFSVLGGWGDRQYWLGILLFYGPGNWFISVIIQSIIFLPLLYYFYRKNPKWAVIIALICDVAIQLGLYAWLGPNYLITSNAEFLVYWHQRAWVATSFIRYIFPVTLGFWFSDGHSIKQDKSLNLESMDQIDSKNSKDKKYLLIVILIIIVFSILMLTLNPNVTIIGYLLIGLFSIIGFIFMWNFADDKKNFLKKQLPLNLGFIILGGGLITIYTEIITNQSPLVYKLLLYAGIIISYSLPLIFAFFIKKEGKNNRNGFIWSFFIISVIYIVNYQFNGLRIEFLFGDYQLMVYGYSALLILLVMNYVPKNPKNKLSDGIRAIGRSTYHILFTQIILLAIFEGIWGTSYFEGNIQDIWFNGIGIGLKHPTFAFLYLLICWIICVPVGVLWNWSERKIFELLKEKIRGKKEMKLIEK